ncbi:ABC transporter permease subunit [Gulosibacter sp. 10]|uniref:ABC transporter permease subunit n=1 Tax=Gulosibacter sp. 10 TaxID=1255570 RepID=UPI00097F695D|nr:ABC transporter permease subunit [Gulosibacter sp. 10]SJM60976.1 Oligopeptide transport system permease protein OppC (TC 3.A.1.5.1) [Gulosibacter sp. 10]
MSLTHPFARMRRIGILLPALLVVAIGVLGPWLAPMSSTSPVGGSFQSVDPGHPLGTDVLGRDVLARVLTGGRTLILQALIATVLGSAAGLMIGVWSGMTRRRRLSASVLRGVDAVAAFPALLLLLLLAAGMPGDDAVLAAAIALVSVPFSVRVNRECTMRLAATDYAREAQARGDGALERVRHDILPGLIPVALAEAGVRFVAATQLAATAGFLGLGAGAPAANWGRMVRENSGGLAENPLPVLVPALLLVVLAVSIALALDRVSDPRMPLGRGSEVLA